MAAQAGLPNLDTLDVFQYYDPDQDALVDIVAADNTHPRVIQDYVVDPVDWQANNRGANRGEGVGPPNGVNTVEGILGFDTDDMVCFVCSQRGDSCPGQDCIDVAKTDFEDVADSKLMIQEARWGYGVFAWANIPAGTLIGEYLGRLLPLDQVVQVDNRYTYAINDHADSDAEQYGNITRYINHHCDCNTEATTAMYGKRACITFRTLRDIVAGEELTIDYGEDYFNAAFPCQCDALAYPHTSQQYRRRVHGDGSVSPSGIGTYGTIRGQRGGGPWRQASAAGPADKGAVAPKEGARRERVEGARVRKNKGNLRTLEKASAPTALRRRSWGSRTYKGGDPDRKPLRRSTRIASAVKA